MPECVEGDEKIQSLWRQDERKTKKEGRDGNIEVGAVGQRQSTSRVQHWKLLHLRRSLEARRELDFLASVGGQAEQKPVGGKERQEAGESGCTPVQVLWKEEAK